MLNIFGIVVQQLPDIGHHRPLVGVVQRNQRRRAGVLHLFLLTGIPDARNRLHLHRTFDFEPRIGRQRGDILVLLFETLNPLLARPGRHSARGFETLLQHRQHLITGEILDDVLVRPTKAQSRWLAQQGQRAVSVESNQTRQLAMHPLKARGRGQTRLFGDDFLKRGLQRINL
ncbi:hypothetical protein D3C76_1101760 [compost metagenome]